jgi:thymidylate synthase|tara:strand:+ start:332 stop:1105 length:774 start_codon:yes stop_codon:yes gene_type:complete
MKILVKSANEAWSGSLGTVFHEGQDIAVRGIMTKELLNIETQVSMSHPEVNLPERKLNKKFRAAEAAWILSGSNKVDLITKYCKQYGNYSDDGLFMSGAYGPPIIDQLPYIVKSLITDRTTRQAVLTIWRPRPYPSKDIPCTVSMQWLIRDDQLHCITNMRSNDIWLGAPYDIFTFSMVSNYLLLLINECTTSKVSLGLLYLNAASLHLYIQHWEEAEKAYSDIEWDHDELSLWKGNNENFKKPEDLIEYLWSQANS